MTQVKGPGEAPKAAREEGRGAYVLTGACIVESVSGGGATLLTYCDGRRGRRLDQKA